MSVKTLALFHAFVIIQQTSSSILDFFPHIRGHKHVKSILKQVIESVTLHKMEILTIV